MKALETGEQNLNELLNVFTATDGMKNTRSLWQCFVFRFFSLFIS